ncbi:glucosaminidase domain-containing protein [Proteinivorax hydrogeniformans]|uniref:Glucosaminidase domain-containing protein n=1 Tax=Proteinivorax hydrogeniformans TaxID=1826727 RepID=A0AAU8HWY9_9FIRM
MGKKILLVIITTVLFIFTAPLDVWANEGDVADYINFDQKIYIDIMEEHFIIGEDYDGVLGFSSKDTKVLQVASDGRLIPQALGTTEVEVFKAGSSVGVVDVHVYLSGDVNGDGRANVSDAIKILRYDAQLESFTKGQRIAADITKSGSVGISDAIKILQMDAGLVDRKPRVSLDSSLSLLQPNDFVQLNAKVLPDSKSDTKVEWASSDETVAEVDSNGMVTAISPGRAKIKASTQDGSSVATTEIIVDWLEMENSYTRSFLYDEQDEHKDEQHNVSYEFEIKDNRVTIKGSSDVDDESKYQYLYYQVKDAAGKVVKANTVPIDFSEYETSFNLFLSEGIYDFNVYFGKEENGDDLEEWLEITSPSIIKISDEISFAVGLDDHNVVYTKYNMTLEEILDKQMAVNPQTDLYGGGWKSAKREDVEYYLNPENFNFYPEEGIDQIVVNASSLNVRRGPSTSYDRITSVSRGATYEFVDFSDGWYKINLGSRKGWVHGDFVLRSAVSSNDVPDHMFQFLILSGSAEVEAEELDRILNNKGTLHGTGNAFIAAGKEHNVNELYLISHALLETGNGTSDLAEGILVDEVDGKEVEPKVVYNMYGIGAKDRDPHRLGAEYAYEAGWFTPEDAIIGGARFISRMYVNHPTYKQDTLYKMRWNPATPATHQYATDIGWAVKQTSNIKSYYDQLDTYVLRFDIPKYLEEK